MKIASRSILHLASAVRVVLRGVWFVFPSSSVVQFHPVVFTVLNFAGVFESLCKEVPKVVVVRGVLKAKVANISKIFIELLWLILVYNIKTQGKDVPG